MGWCRGATEIFDRMMQAFYLLPVSWSVKLALVLILLEVLDEQDWDCWSDSAYYDDELVKIAMKRARHG